MSTTTNSQTDTYWCIHNTDNYGQRFIPIYINHTLKLLCITQFPTAPRYGKHPFQTAKPIIKAEEKGGLSVKQGRADFLGKSPQHTGNIAEQSGQTRGPPPKKIARGPVSSCHPLQVHALSSKISYKTSLCQRGSGETGMWDKTVLPAWAASQLAPSSSWSSCHKGPELLGQDGRPALLLEAPSLY